MIVRLFFSASGRRAIEDVSTTFLGIVYVALLFGFQVAIRTGTDGRQWLVFLYFIIWASDIGHIPLASLWQTRLYEKISPKKSIEGLIGALIASAGMALFCRWWFMPPSVRVRLSGSPWRLQRPARSAIWWSRCSNAPQG